MFRHSVLAAAFLAAFCVSANAGVITKQVDFSISGIGPIDPVTGTLKISLDPTLPYTDQTVGIAVSSLNLTVSSPIGFNYFPLSGMLMIGGTQNGVGGLSSLTYDFSLLINYFSTAPEFFLLDYVQGGATGYIGDRYNENVVVNQLAVKDVQEIPEPVTGSLFGAGFAGLMAMGRKRKKA